MNIPGISSTERAGIAAKYIPVNLPRPSAVINRNPDPSSRENFDRLEKEVSSRSYHIAMEKIHENAMREFINAISRSQWATVKAWLADDVEFVEVPLRLGGIFHGPGEVVAYFMKMRASAYVSFSVEYMVVDQGYITSIVKMCHGIPTSNYHAVQTLAWIFSLNDDNKISRMEHREIGEKKSSVTAMAPLASRSGSGLADGN
ncbi:hypothetical protein CKAH01_14892 [Colletotrichum kahawae]|uniref:SnoaL-like domain-containing protein n=1 Tax=Colletotrichum kahawae TaxID=34407 RepID=A0AAE0D9K2_COLKA|nr:hypothetical protein CKAH01_14892 [Colletotrichum kahawae]